VVQLASYTRNYLIMESLNKLKRADLKFKGITVAHNMTRNEREECLKKLVAETNMLGEHDTMGNTCTGNLGQMRIVI